MSSLHISFLPNDSLLTERIWKPKVWTPDFRMFKISKVSLQTKDSKLRFLLVSLNLTTEVYEAGTLFSCFILEPCGRYAIKYQLYGETILLSIV